MEEERKCRVCGCTQLHACPGGCYWVEEDLCSQCAVCEVCGNTGETHDMYKCDSCGRIVCADCGEDFDHSFVCNDCLSKQEKCDCTKCRNRETFNCPFDGEEYQYCYDCPDFEMTDINKYIKEAHQNAVDHGWWENPKTFGELIVLIHSELSEALEEHRNHKDVKDTYYSGKSDIEGGEVTLYDFVPSGNITKPEGIPSELADVVIRVFDMCGYYGIDLEAAIQEKMKYNKNRPYKHGGKKI